MLKFSLKEGAITGSTKVHIFGRNFEIAICHTIVCQFGSKNSTPGLYISNQHITCLAPDYDGVNTTQPVSVMLDGRHFLKTGFSFSYKFTPIQAPTFADYDVLASSPKPSKSTIPRPRYPIVTLLFIAAIITNYLLT